jgi:hypothetical protein
MATQPVRPYLKGQLIRRDTQGESYYESDEGEDSGGNREEDEAEVRVHKFSGTPSVDEEEGGEE